MTYLFKSSSENVSSSIKVIDKDSKYPGRPIGAKNKSAELRNYKAYRWTPKHDQVVALHVIGKYNNEIAEIVGFSSVHITNILSTEQARELIDIARKNIHKNSSDRIKNIQEKALCHIETFINDDNNLAIKSPFNFIDRTIAIAKGVGTLKATEASEGSVSNKNITNNTVIISEASVERLGKALELSNLINQTDVLDRNSLPRNTISLTEGSGKEVK